jgi:hypothetical protein
VSAQPPISREQLEEELRLDEEIRRRREMMTSWLACGYIAWMVEWHSHMFWVLQYEKDDKAVQLIEYCRILHRNQQRWMQDCNPLVVDNTAELKLADGGHILAVPKGENQIRIHHPHGYLMDEAAFLPEAEECHNAVSPVANRRRRTRLRTPNA